MSKAESLSLPIVHTCFHEVAASCLGCCTRMLYVGNMAEALPICIAVYLEHITAAHSVQILFKALQCCGIRL